MFDKLKEYFANKKAEKAVMESPIHLVAMKAGLEANIETGMDKAVQKNKRIGEMQGEWIAMQINSLVSSKDQFLSLREQYANAMLEFGFYEVLVLNKKDDPTGLTKLNGISGELNKHLAKLIKVNKKLKELIHGVQTDKIDNKFIIQFIDGLYKNTAFKFRVIDAIRRHLKDYNQNLKKDWMKPFRYCVCVAMEHDFRKELKLKTLISDINKIQYSTFVNTVLNGHKYPDLEFIEGHKDAIKDKRLYFPKSFS